MERVPDFYTDDEVDGLLVVAEHDEKAAREWAEAVRAEQERRHLGKLATLFDEWEL